MSQDSEEPNIARAVGFLRRRGLWIVPCFVLAAGAAYGYSKHEVKKYSATASLSFSSSQLSQEIAGLPTSASSSLQQQSANLELLRLGDMAERTAVVLGQGLTEQKVGAAVSISGQPESSIASVTASSTSPELAAKIANVYAQAFVKEQEGAERLYFRSALTFVHKQLAALSPQQRNGTAGVDLQDRAQSLGLLAELRPSTVRVAQEALVPTQPSSPKTLRNTLIGAVLGLFVGLGLALLLERIDPRVRDSDELEAIYRVPLLGVVPQSAALSRFARDGQEPPPALPLAEAEAFHMIRARLRSFNTARDIRTVLVSSAAPGEGKTTVARHVAGAAARMGSRVLLLEVNLRRPTLARQMGIQSQTGLPDVLNGIVHMEAATQSIGSQATLGAETGVRTLDVLPSGPSTPPNPVELIESHAMEALLEQASSAYDLVVIDAPELAAVSDAFLLLSKVDGVVIVDRVGHSRRDVAKRLRQLLDASDAPLVGVIANGVKPRGYDFDVEVSDDASAGKPAHSASSGDVSVEDEAVSTVKA